MLWFCSEHRAHQGVISAVFIYFGGPTQCRVLPVYFCSSASYQASVKEALAVGVHIGRKLHIPRPDGGSFSVRLQRRAHFRDNQMSVCAAQRWSDWKNFQQQIPTNPLSMYVSVSMCAWVCVSGCEFVCECVCICVEKNAVSPQRCRKMEFLHVLFIQDRLVVLNQALSLKSWPDDVSGSNSVCHCL